MEVALIPPGSQCHWNTSRKFEMIIPEGIKHSSDYSSYYSRLVKVRPSYKYVMIDNGAFESAALTDHRLLEIAHVLRVNEVAAPDVMGDVYHSLNRLEAFIYTIEMIYDFRLRVMAIVQGQNLVECKNFITYIANTQHANVTWTIAFPKHLVKTTGHQDVRLKLVRWTQREYDHLFQIHALGYNFPGEVQGLAELGIRSLDTSAPFVAALHGWNLNDHLEPLPRTQDYWSIPADQFDTKLVEENIQLLDKWAGGRQ